MLDGRDSPSSCGVPATRSLVHVNKVAVFMAVCWVHSLRAEMLDKPQELQGGCARVPLLDSGRRDGWELGGLIQKVDKRQ